MTLGEIVERLCGVSHVSFDGASLFHDEFGHVISPILLTRWPEDSRFNAPVVWSTETIIPEQLAELCQRMIIRASPRRLTGGLAKARIHVAGTLDESMLRRVEAELLSPSASPETIKFPDQDGEKLTKAEALAWTYLYAVEDIHIFAERYSLQKGRRRIHPERLDAFRERVAELMYSYALSPASSQESGRIDERLDLIGRCFEALDMPEDRDARVIFGAHMSDATLSRFYDTFLPHFDALDAAGVEKTGRPFSQLRVEELHALDTRAFLPSTDPPFTWMFAGEAVRATDKWLGVLRFDETRDVWLIVDVIPPAEAA